MRNRNFLCCFMSNTKHKMGSRDHTPNTIHLPEAVSTREDVFSGSCLLGPPSLHIPRLRLPVFAWKVMGLWVSRAWPEEVGHGRL